MEGLNLGVEGFGFRDLEFRGFRFEGLRFRSLWFGGFGFRDLEFGIWISGFRVVVSALGI